MTSTFRTAKLLLAMALGIFITAQAKAVPAPIIDASLKLWLDASSIGTGPVANWTDLSGNGNHATVTFGAAPVNTAGAIGGMNAVRYDSTNISTTPVVVNSGAYSIFTVSKMNGGNNQRLISSDDRNWLLGYWGTNRDRMYANGWVVQGNTAPGTDPHLYAATGTGALTRVISDGSLIASNAGGLAAPGAIALGGWGQTNTETSHGDVAEVLVYNRVLSLDEQRTVGQYLTQKYSLNATYDGNVAQHQPIVDGSGAWPNGAFNTGQYSADKAVDGTATDRNDGALGGGSYWLGKDGDTAEHFVVDLGVSQDIKTIGLRNTHNQAANDRGTREFVIRASNDLAAISGSSPTAPVILTGKLSTSMGGNGDSLIPTELFNGATGLATGSYRYVRFETVSASFQAGGTPAIDGGATNGHVGLNEILIYTDDRGGNVAAGKAIVAGSGSFPNNANPLAGLFSAAHVTDQRLDDFRDDANPTRTSYWLGREGVNNEFFVIDLGTGFAIDRIDLQNSHNGGFNDRGTANFNIQGSLDGINFFDVFSDTLANVAGTGVNIPIESFSALDGDFGRFYARYIRFEAETRYGASAALNEIFVFGVSVPEPSTACLALLAMGTLMSRARRKAA